MVIIIINKQQRNQINTATKKIKNKNNEYKKV